VPKGKPSNVEVIEKAGCRFVIATYANGEIVQKRIEPDQKPKRKPRKPFARARKPLRSEFNE
jgi:hypothetical protein